MNDVDVENIAAGNGIIAKNIYGDWSLDEHLVHGSSKASVLHDPWIATTSDISIARKFNEINQLGIVEIDLSKIHSLSFKKGYVVLTRDTRGYHFSI